MMFQSIAFVEDFVEIVAAILQEQSIICFGQTEVISSVILGLESLIRPFQWQMALVPVLPTSLLESIEAPVPMLAGITTAQYL
jgi:hypothetical protein